MDRGARREGERGRRSKLADQAKEARREVASRLAYSWTRLSEARLWEESKKRGLSLSLSAAYERLALSQRASERVYLKPTLAEQTKALRARRSLAQVDRSRGRGELRLKGDKRVVAATLIEGVSALARPKVRCKPRVESATRLATLAQPQKAAWRGEEIDLGGEVGAFPCAKEAAAEDVVVNGRASDADEATREASLRRRRQETIDGAAQRRLSRGLRRQALRVVYA